MSLLDSSEYAEQTGGKVLEHYFEEKNGVRYHVSILADEDCEAPLEGDEDIFVALWHRNYRNPSPGLVNPQEVIDYCKRYKAFRFPMEAYIHGGIAIDLRNEGCFPDREWDVGYLGDLIIERKFIENMGWKRMNAARHEKLREIARYTARRYGQWLDGECYGFSIKKLNADGTVLEEDGCCGYIGREEVLEAVREWIG